MTYSDYLYEMKCRKAFDAIKTQKGSIAREMIDTSEKVATASEKVKVNNLPGVSAPMQAGGKGYGESKNIATSGSVNTSAKGNTNLGTNNNVTKHLG